MSLGSWNPEDGSETVTYQVDKDLVARCASFAASGNFTTLPSWEKANLPTSACQMMKLDAATWQPALEGLDESTLHNLIRFFTVAEQALPHWHGGDKSPVIWITRHLKKLGKPLPRDLVLWIKGNSDNRFLPNGPIL